MPTTTAKVIADSICGDYRITTFECYYPRFILAEVNTHRMIARSTASSRAIPIAKHISNVWKDPFVPRSFGKNQPGMQAGENLAPTATFAARLLWRTAARTAAIFAWGMSRLGVHKQLANRLMEPFMYSYTVMTATEWINFFALRTSPEAQPEFQELALAMQVAYNSSSPTVLEVGQWHTPYVPPGTLDDKTALDVSAARCARVSYRTHDGSISTVDKDIKLAKTLLDSRHLSPFDHQARAVLATSDSITRHLVGWMPYRTFVENKHGIACRRF